MLIQRSISFFMLVTISSFVNAGFIGGGITSNSSKSFDHQTDGFRVDFGSNINNSLDLEFTYVDYGTSSYDDPSYTEPDINDSNDRGSFNDIGYGGVSNSDGGKHYTGISDLNTFGISAGFKLKKSINNWLQVYGRASFVAWESEADIIVIYGTRVFQDGDGDITSEAEATNQNPCDSFTLCRQELDRKKHQAVDFWYGYGLIAKPASWIAIRAEYSIITLNAVAFPKGVIEGLNASLEIHF